MSIGDQLELAHQTAGRGMFWLVTMIVKRRLWPDRARWAAQQLRAAADIIDQTLPPTGDRR